MNFAFNEEQTAVRELAAQIFADHNNPERLRDLESSQDAIDRDLWKALAESNLLGITIPEAYGGSEMGLIELALLLEEQGRTLCPVPLLATVVQAALPIAEFGTDAQREQLLPGVASGELFLSAALTEPGGFDPAKPRVTATRDGDSWRLSGIKTCVPIAHLAHRILVPARTGAETIGVFLLDPTAEGVTLELQRATNHEVQAQVTLQEARVAADDVLGDPEGGLAIVRWLEDRTLAAVCAIQLGVSSDALSRTAEYTGVRKQFGKPIGAFQGVSLRAADAFIDLEAMRATLLQALWRLDAGLPAETETRVAKWWACRGGSRVAHTAMHLHGGIGADVDYPIHRYLLWSKQLDITLGGAAPQLARIGELLATG